jgi:hypothetical protein
MSVNLSGVGRKDFSLSLTARKKETWDVSNSSRMVIWAFSIVCLSLVAPSSRAQKADIHPAGEDNGFAQVATAEPTARESHGNGSASSGSSATPAEGKSSSNRTSAKAAPDPAPPQTMSSAYQFIFFGSNGTSFASSPVVSWDDAGQLMEFTPNPTAGAQTFMLVSPTTYQANCGTVSTPTQIESDVDGTLYFIGHCGGDTAPGLERFFFRLDSSGSLALVGSTYGTMAGGIGTDLNGNTCLLYVNNDGSFAPNQGCGNVATVFAPSTGLATQYAGLPSSGVPTGMPSNGFPFILRSIDTNLIGSVSNYTLYTTTASGYGGPGLYRLEAYIVSTASAAGATLAFTVSFNDGQANQTLMSGTPAYFDTPGAFLTFSEPFYVAANTAITASTITTNSPTYHIVLRLIAE